VYGKLDTSWLASWGPYQPGAPVGDSKYVVVGMIEQAGTGASAAGPMLRQIWEGLLGANGTAPATAGGSPAHTLPKVKPSQLAPPVPEATVRPIATSTATGTAGPSPSRHVGISPSSSPDVLPTRSGSPTPTRSAR
jgi:hypothetical protein